MYRDIQKTESRMWICPQAYADPTRRYIVPEIIHHWVKMVQVSWPNFRFREYEDFLTRVGCRWHKTRSSRRLRNTSKTNSSSNFMKQATETKTKQVNYAKTNHFHAFTAVSDQSGANTWPSPASDNHASARCYVFITFQSPKPTSLPRQTGLFSSYLICVPSQHTRMQAWTHKCTYTYYSFTPHIPST